MSNTRRDVIANYIGAGWSATLSLITIPLLLSMLGAESYGLIAFFLSFKAIATVFDFGLAVATNREIAFRLGGDDNSVDRLIATVEPLYCTMGVVISFIVWFLLRTFLSDWVSTDGLTSSQLVMTSLQFSASLCISWPVVLYQNILRGIEEHLAYNVSLVCSATFRNIGALLGLLLISPTIEVFMAWYLIVSIIEVLMYWAVVRWKLLSVSCAAQRCFDLNSLAGMKKFALGTGFSSVLAVVIMQLDKMLISRFLSLELLGYYSAILAIVGAFGKLTTPIVRAVFPKLTSTYGSGDMDSVADMYRRYAQSIANLLVPIVVLFIAFSLQILELWLADRVTAEYLQNVLIFLSMAYMFFSLSNMSIIVQMVFKNIRTLFLVRAVALLISIPLLSVLIIFYGLEGAAVGILACSIFLFLVLTIFTSRKIFTQYQMNETVMLVLPALVSIPVFSLLQGIFSLWLPDNLSWTPLALTGLIVSYLIIFRSYFKRNINEQ